MEKRNPDPIFIVGNPRSGTTLMARVLSSHPQIYILNETHYIDEFWQFTKQQPPASEMDPRAVINKMLLIQERGYFNKNEQHDFGEETDQLIAAWEKSENRTFSGLVKIIFQYIALKKGKVWPGDQTPRHIFSITEILNQFPDAKIINMVRDPRAQVLSQKRKWMVSKRYQRPVFEIIRTRLNYHPITMSLLWKRGVERALKAEQSVSPARMRTIRFEDFVTSPEKHIKDLCHWLGIDYCPDMLNVGVEGSSNAADSKKRNIDPSIIHNWQRHIKSAELFLVEWLTKKHLVQAGYKITGKWPNPFSLLCWTFYWPIQVGIIFIMNMGRMGNPFIFIKDRLIPEKAHQRTNPK